MPSNYERKPFLTYKSTLRNNPHSYAVRRFSSVLHYFLHPLWELLSFLTVGNFLFLKDLSDLDTERTKQRQWGYPTALCPTMYVCTSRVCFVSNVMICDKYASLCYSPNKLNKFPLATSDANTIETILKSLIRIFTDGPAVSLKGSPTVSPTTAALWFSLPLPL